MIPIDSRPITIEGACHCHSVRFRAVLPHGFASARRCDCSFCRMRGAVAVTGSVDGFEILSGQDDLTLYQFNTGVARHWFCSRCGVYTHHRRRSNPTEYGINAACLDGVSPFDFACVIVQDGIDHPADQPDGKSRVAGRLRYTPEA